MKIKHGFLFFVSRVSLMPGIFILLACFFAGAIPAYAATPSFVRVIHASPDIGTADVFVDGSVLLSSFQFGSVTDYAPIPPGPHKVQIAFVGKGVGAAVITQTLAVSPGVAYTVAATGTKATGLGLTVFIDNNLVSSNMAKVRVYQLSPDAGAISVSNGSSTVLNSLTYQQASSYVVVPASSYTFNVTPSNTSATAHLTVSSTLKTNTVTSIFAVGLVVGTPNIRLVQAQTNGIPGLPGTGSDPNIVSKSNGSQPLSFWLVVMLIVAVAGIGGITTAKNFARKIVAWRSHSRV